MKKYGLAFLLCASSVEAVITLQDENFFDTFPRYDYRPTKHITLKGNLDCRWNNNYTIANTQLTFSEPVIDSLGQSHDLNFNFKRDAMNLANGVRWNLEITCPDGNVHRPATAAANAGANYSAATPMSLVFNYDGTPNSFDGFFAGNPVPQLEIQFNTIPAANLVINMDFGTPGMMGVAKRNGLTSIAAPSGINVYEHDGLSTAAFQDVSITTISNEKYLVIQYQGGRERRVKIQ